MRCGFSLAGWKERRLVEWMNGVNRRMGFLLAGLVALAGIPQATAELPVLDEEWLGYFVGFQNKKFQFSITSQGKAAIKVLNRKGEPVNQKLTIPVEFLVEELLPGGKVTAKALKPESLESAQPATEKPVDVVIKGMVTGDAAFEVFVNEDSGVISLGGRLLDPGKLTKNPLRFSIRLKFPDAYSSAAKSAGEEREEKLEDMMKRDRMQLTWTDGKRLKLETDKDVDAGSKEINGSGISAMQFEFSTYDERKFELLASSNSSITLSAAQAAPLYKGFLASWTADPAKDPEAKARLAITVR
jgi:hypothetical protein